MKKILNFRRHCALLLAMCLIVYLFPVNVLANEIEQSPDATTAPTEEPITPAAEDAGDTLWIAEGTCGENLTWTLDAEGTLTISGTGDMEDYGTTDNAPPWKGYSGYVDSPPTSETIHRVVIEEGVTSIGEDAFWSFPYLETAEIPSTVTQIGAAAFGRCESLNNVVIPDGVTVLENYVFGDCYALSNITIPDSITVIDEWAFSGAGFTEIVIPSSVTTIGNDAFRYCYNLQNVTLPDGLISIGAAAFRDTSLNNIWIPESVITIGESAFAYCGLTSINFPPNYTKIEYGTFICLEVERLVIPEWIDEIECDAFGYPRFKEVVFLGDAPIMDHPFTGSENNDEEKWTMTVYYPGDNATWTQETFDSFAMDGWNSFDVICVPYYNYEILDGADSTVVHGDDLTVRASGAYSDFVGISVDGNTVAPEHYTATEGSTIITLKAEYLETLMPGTHTLTVSFTHGEVSTTFTLNEKEEPAVPPTEPVTPTEPPVAPTVKPTEPESPTEPTVKPTEPESPSEPTVIPTEPETPTETEPPTEPDKVTEPEPTTPTEPDTAEPSDPTNPATGDGGISLPVLMMALCVAAVVILIGSKKRMI